MGKRLYHDTDIQQFVDGVTSLAADLLELKSHAGPAGRVYSEDPRPDVSNATSASEIHAIEQTAARSGSTVTSEARGSAGIPGTVIPVGAPSGGTPAPSALGPSADQAAGDREYPFEHGGYGVGASRGFSSGEATPGVSFAWSTITYEQIDALYQKAKAIVDAVNAAPGSR